MAGLSPERGLCDTLSTCVSHEEHARHHDVMSRSSVLCSLIPNMCSRDYDPNSKRRQEMQSGPCRDTINQQQAFDFGLRCRLSVNSERVFSVCCGVVEIFGGLSDTSSIAYSCAQ